MEPLLLVTVPKGKIDPIVKKDEKIEFAEVKVVSMRFGLTSLDRFFFFVYDDLNRPLNLQGLIRKKIAIQESV